MRPVLFITSILALLWAVVMAVSNIRDRGDDFGELDFSFPVVEIEADEELSQNHPR